MRVCEIKLSDFRSFEEMALLPGPGLNILQGANAQGKSTILEGIALLATTRSIRASRESEMIRQGEPLASVTAEVERERDGALTLQMLILETEKKSVRVNGMKRTRVVDLLGEFNVVTFGSADLQIVSGEPSVRRHFLNVEISQISPRYVYDLAHYKRVLEQRNRLLRDLRDRPNSRAESGLEAWNQQLVQYGSAIVARRRFYVDRIAPIADRIHRELTDGASGVEVRYLPSIPLDPPDANDDERAVADSFAKHLERVRDDEYRRGSTLSGPQRDDLTFLIEGRDARLFGSQGQQRTVVLALKLAEHQLIRESVGEPPVLLLDDVMSDLDDQRRRHLLDRTVNCGQVFLTCTNIRSFPEPMLMDAALFKVAAGTVAQNDRAELAEV